MFRSPGGKIEEFLISPGLNGVVRASSVTSFGYHDGT
jgi:hypothetical protein